MTTALPNAPKVSSITQPHRDNLQEMFHRVQHVRYAVISPYSKLPMDEAGDTMILTDQMEGLRNIWNLIRIEHSTYRAELSSGKPVRFHIYEKGKNLFPESFESSILGRAYLHERCVKVASEIEYPIVRLFWRLFYEGFLAEHADDRRMLMDFVIRHTGQPIRTKYRHLTFCNRTVVPQQPTGPTEPFVSRP